MTPAIPQHALQYGFGTAPASTHTSRTMMLRDLSLLMDASQPGTDYDELRRLVVEENACMKATEVGRRETFRRLRELYALRLDCPLYRALRDLWTAEAERPLLAMICANARDSLLRVTAPVILDAPEGSLVFSTSLSDALQSAYPDRYSPIIRAGFGRHAISSWAQSGHLSGRTKKTRSRAVSGPASAAYALFLGHLCGGRGLPLLHTFWARLLDTSPAQIDALAFSAAQRGWLDYRRIGDVSDIGFSHLLREES